ncbi:SDR family NAD(P)-dependent oxidoreductase [Sphingobium estronivorans]|uniref:SDR family NAD(P)-dependent oxidoreductase n=1 Tax=Sphingobium estronivorans TaxID=1577690 RepID=UPI0019689C9A|nr:SDR family oxidoreductase [Sphingobium estronivorans]
MSKDLQSRLSLPGTGVVITGGASGIGLASARALASVGRPVVIWDIHEGRAVEAAQAVRRETGTPCTGMGVDVRDPQAIAGAAERTRAALPSIGGLVHCAGIVDTASLDGITLQSWDDGMNVHLRPIVLLLQAFLEDMKRQPGSAMVATASINATLGNAINPIYTAAKGGVLSLVRSLADRLGRDGIRINAVSPGQIVTPMMTPAINALPQGHFEQRILLERIGEPEEIGRVVRFLLSDEASYITAAEIVVDGGNISSQR